MRASIWSGTQVHRNAPVPEEARENAIVQWIFGGPPVPPQLEEEDRCGLVFVLQPAAEAAGKAVRKAVGWWKGNDTRG